MWIVFTDQPKNYLTECIIRSARKDDLAVYIEDHDSYLDILVTDELPGKKKHIDYDLSHRPGS